MPGALGIAANAMGVTTAELSKMMEDGELLSSVFLPRFSRALRQTFPAGEEAVTSLEAEIQRMNNAFFLLATEVGDAGLKDGLKDIVKAITEFAKSDTAVQIARDIGIAFRDLGTFVKDTKEILDNFDFEALANDAKLLISPYEKLKKLFPETFATIEETAEQAFMMLESGAVSSGKALINAYTIAQDPLKEYKDLVEATEKELGDFDAQRLLSTLKEAQSLGAELNETTIFTFLKLADDDLRETTDLIKKLEEALKTIPKETAEGSLQFDRLSKALNILNRERDRLQGSVEVGETLADESRKTLALDEKIKGLAKTYGTLENTLAPLEQRVSDLSEELSKNANPRQLADLNKLKEVYGTQLVESFKQTNEAIQGVTNAMFDSKSAAEADITNKENLGIISKQTAIELRNLAAAQEKLKLQQEAAEDTFNFGKESQELEFLIQGFQRYRTEVEAQAFAQAAMAGFVDEATGAITEQGTALLDAATKSAMLRDKWNTLKKDYQKNPFDDIAESFDLLGKTGSKAFKDIISAAGNFIKSQQKLFTQEEKIKKLKEQKLSADEQGISITELQSQLDKDRTVSQLQGLSDVTAATSTMFKEGSREAKIAMLASEGLAAASAIAAIANQGNGDPYTAFARIAAMIGLMTSVGAFKGGGSGSAAGGSAPVKTRVETQGTGTVLGDAEAQSKSITNALERLESVDLDQYFELRRLNAQMHQLNVNLTGLATTFLRNVGVKGFDSSLLGTFNADRTFGTQLNNAVGDVVKNDPIRLLFDGLADDIEDLIGDNFVSDAIDAASKLIDDITGGIIEGLFGGDTDVREMAAGFQVAGQTFAQLMSGAIEVGLFKEFKVNPPGSGNTRFETVIADANEEIGAQISQIFQGLGDATTEALALLGISTEGIFRTFEIDEFMVALSGINGEALSAEEQLEAINAVFSATADNLALHAIPSLTEFQQAGEGLFDTLVRVASETAMIDRLLGNVGLSMEGFIQTLGTVDPLSDIAGVEFSQNLISAAGGFDRLESVISSFNENVLTDSKRVEVALKNARALLKQEFSEIGGIFTAAGLDLDLDQLTLEGFQNVMDQLFSQAESEADIVNILEAGNALANYYQVIEEGNDLLQESKDGFSDLFDTIQEFLDSLDLSDISPLTNAQRLEAAREDFNKTLALAQQGDEKALDEITGAADAFLNEARDFFASSTAFTEIFNSVKGSLQSLVDNQIVSEGSTSQQILGNIIKEEQQQALNQTASDALASADRAQFLEDYFADLNAGRGDSIVQPRGSFEEVFDAGNEQLEALKEVLMESSNAASEGNNISRATKEAIDLATAEAVAAAQEQIRILEASNDQNSELLQALQDLLVMFRSGAATVHVNASNLNSI